MKKLLAESLGTFALVLCGTGAIILDLAFPGHIGNIGIALVFGVIVTLMIYAFGKISGAHINPAVTIAFSITHLFNKREVARYIIAQLIGAISASLLLRKLFPYDKKLGATLPAGSWQQSFIIELLLTYFLMLVILFIGQHKTTKKYTALAVGAVVGLEAFFAGPTTGASMNPARSMAPAIVSGHIEYLWVYILSTIIGALLASLTWLAVTKTKA
jgi:aquaporin NIP